MMEIENDRKKYGSGSLFPLVNVAMTRNVFLGR